MSYRSNFGYSVGASTPFSASKSMRVNIKAYNYQYFDVTEKVLEIFEKRLKSIGFEMVSKIKLSLSHKRTSRRQKIRRNQYPREVTGALRQSIAYRVTIHGKTHATLELGYDMTTKPFGRKKVPPHVYGPYLERRGFPIFSKVIKQYRRKLIDILGRDP